MNMTTKYQNTMIMIEGGEEICCNIMQEVGEVISDWSYEALNH